MSRSRIINVLIFFRLGTFTHSDMFIMCDRVQVCVNAIDLKLNKTFASALFGLDRILWTSVSNITAIQSKAPFSIIDKLSLTNYIKIVFNNLALVKTEKLKEMAICHQVPKPFNSNKHLFIINNYICWQNRCEVANNRYVMVVSWIAAQIDE